LLVDTSRWPVGRDLRCLCGRLVARWVGTDIELRCQRCKRVVRIVVEADGQLRIREEA
jgi:phage FluMu protein Com